MLGRCLAVRAPPVHQAQARDSFVADPHLHGGSGGSDGFVCGQCEVRAALIDPVGL